MLVGILAFVIFLMQIHDSLAGIWGIGNLNNLTDSTQNHNRHKKSLIFGGGGSVKIVIAGVYPVDLDDKVNWRGLIYTFNLQGPTYDIPTTPVYPWDKWEDTFARDLKMQKDKFDRSGEYRKDDSRIFMYALLEHLFNKYGNTKHGRICLLRCICENAQIHEHIGIYAEVMDIILTPGKDDIDDDYKDALRAGRAGADCWSLYSKCPKSANFLEHYFLEL